VTKAPPSCERLVEQERLVLGATELVLGLMHDERVDRAELAERVGISQRQLANFIAGRTSPSIKALANIVGALGHRIELSATKLLQQDGAV
jgi:transcriptional regulator with XRE-family HTH domain